MQGLQRYPSGDAGRGLRALPDGFPRGPLCSRGLVEMSSTAGGAAADRRRDPPAAQSGNPVISYRKQVQPRADGAGTTAAKVPVPPGGMVRGRTAASMVVTN